MSNEIAIYSEKDPRFRKQKNLAGQSTQRFVLEHQPQYGLIVEEPEVLVMMGRSYNVFNESSMEDLNKAKVGDIIETYCDNTTDVYKAWNPSAPYDVGDNFMKNYEIRLVLPDRKGFPIILATTVL